MDKIETILGQKFGRLLVASFLYSEKNKKYFLCVCDCGNEKVVSSGHLRIGDTKSCGCLRKETTSRLSKERTMEKASNWKGDNVGKKALHTRIRQQIQNSNVCTFCKKECKTDLANISQEYKHTLDDWMWLCRECHQRYDKGWIWKENEWFKKCKICKKQKMVNDKNFYKHKSKKTTSEWYVICIPCTKKI